MIAPKIVAEIRRLLDLKTHSQRRIAALLGVSRGTVAAIASGRRATTCRRTQCDDDPAEPSGPPARCPGCGGLVYMPCLLCRLRKTERRARPRDGRATDLRGVAAIWISGPNIAQRYEEVRAWRRTSGQQTIRQTNMIMNEPILVNYADVRDADSRRRPAAVSPAKPPDAADRRGRPVAVRPCRDGRLVERPADVRRDDLRRRAGTTPVEHRRSAGPASSTCTRPTPRGGGFRAKGRCWR